VGDRAAERALARLVADVYELAGELRRAGDELAGTAGQSQARWQLLSVASEGDWTVPAAARRLGVSRQAVQRIADLLVEDGLARLEENPAHRRSPLLRLTDAGHEALGAITAVSRDWRERVSAGLSGEEVERARMVLRAVLDGARDHPPPGG